METTNFIYELRIDWKLGQDTERWWNQLCADIMEVFGLPGIRYTTHPSESFMYVRFNSKKDYQLCKILLSDKI
jgi:hypothetical protein